MPPSASEAGGLSVVAEAAAAHATSDTTPDYTAERAALAEALSRYEPPAPKGDTHAAPDTLGAHRFVFSQPLPQFNSESAEAYLVVDEEHPERALYGLLCAPHLPLRMGAIRALSGRTVPHLLTPVASGPVVCSHLAATRYALVFPQPTGRPLSEWLAERGPMPESMLMQELASPLMTMLAALSSANVCHGRLNPANIYVGDKLLVGECVSTPCGYGQPVFYEPPERLDAHPLGKGEGDTGTDSYALGVVVLHALLGGNPLAQMPPEVFAYRLGSLGAYNALVGDREPGDMVRDVLRGLLNEDREDRWGIAQLQLWQGGKKYNLIRPSIPREAPRPFQFDGQDYINRRSLAYAMAAKWDVARKEIQDSKLVRWVELSAHKPELAGDLERLSRSAKLATNDRERNELLARCLILIDSNGPIRYRKCIAAPDGLGPLLADAYRSDQTDVMDAIRYVIEEDLPQYWHDSTTTSASPAALTALNAFQKVRNHMTAKGFGFGMERALYDLNPGLPCQSPQLRERLVLTAADMLQALDHTARDRGEHEILDRHGAAFLASRLGIPKEMRFPEFDIFPALRSHPRLITLRLLAQAERQSNPGRLRGLSAWMASQLLPVTEHLHSRVMRTQLRAQLVAAARSGRLADMDTLMFDSAMTRDDFNGFRKAARRYLQNQTRIRELQDDALRTQEAEIMGQRAAVMVSYATSAIAILLSLRYVL